jgi:hypothetical protein
MGVFAKGKGGVLTHPATRMFYAIIDVYVNVNCG